MATPDYTWVEQQGVSVEDFDARRDPAFRDRLVDALIERFNAEECLNKCIIASFHCRFGSRRRRNADTELDS